MRQIWKFPLEKQDNLVEIPLRAKILSFQMQGVTPCLWAEVETTAAKEPRRFIILGTGHPFPIEPYPETYIGTTQDGDFVWHLYETVRRK